MDKIFLRQLEIDTAIGIWEWERRIKQTVTIDLELATDARNASTYARQYCGILPGGRRRYARA